MILTKYAKLFWAKSQAYNNYKKKTEKKTEKKKSTCINEWLAESSYSTGVAKSSTYLKRHTKS